MSAEDNFNWRWNQIFLLFGFYSTTSVATSRGLRLKSHSAMTRLGFRAMFAVCQINTVLNWNCKWRTSSGEHGFTEINQCRSDLITLLKLIWYICDTNPIRQRDWKEFNLMDCWSIPKGRGLRNVPFWKLLKKSEVLGYWLNATKRLHF